MCSFPFPLCAPHFPQELFCFSLSNFAQLRVYQNVDVNTRRKTSFYHATIFPPSIISITISYLFYTSLNWLCINDGIYYGNILISTPFSWRHFNLVVHIWWERRAHSLLLPTSWTLCLFLFHPFIRFCITHSSQLS